MFQEANKTEILWINYLYIKSVNLQKLQHIPSGHDNSEYRKQDNSLLV